MRELTPMLALVVPLTRACRRTRCGRPLRPLPSDCSHCPLQTPWTISLIAGTSERVYLHCLRPFNQPAAHGHGALKLILECHKRPPLHPAARPQAPCERPSMKRCWRSGVRQDCMAGQSTWRRSLIGGWREGGKITSLKSHHCGSQPPSQPQTRCVLCHCTQ